MSQICVVHIEVPDGCVLQDVLPVGIWRGTSERTLLGWSIPIAPTQSRPSDNLTPDEIALIDSDKD